MASSEKSVVLSLTDSVDYSQKTTANSVVEIDKNDPKSWSTKRKLLVALGPILTGFVGYVLNPEF
jgi:hypothetical protein